MYYEGSRHYHPILNLKVAIGSCGYCVACNVGFRKRSSMHKKMPTLLRHPVLRMSRLSWLNAIRAFASSSGVRISNISSQRSYNQSLTSVCESIKICNGCGWLVNSKLQYDCDVVYCKTCHSLLRIICVICGLFVVKPQ